MTSKKTIVSDLSLYVTPECLGIFPPTVNNVFVHTFIREVLQEYIITLGWPLYTISKCQIHQKESWQGSGPTPSLFAIQRC